MPPKQKPKPARRSGLSARTSTSSRRSGGGASARATPRKTISKAGARGRGRGGARNSDIQRKRFLVLQNPDHSSAN